MRFETDGIGLYVEVEGEENTVPVVFLHGITSSGKSWDWLPSEITGGRMIIRVDFRGHGRSDHAADTYDIGHYGRDVVAVLQGVARRPAVLVGHSLGGAVAWWVAQHHPELVTAAFLEDPPLFLGEPAEFEGSVFQIAFTMLRAAIAEWQQAGLSPEEFAKRAAAIPFGPDANVTFGDVAMDDAVAAMGFSFQRVDPRVLDSALDGSALAEIDTASPVVPPVFVLAADDALGTALPASHSDRLARSHPAVEVVRVPGAGHGIHDERRHRELFCEHLSRFLARQT